MTTDIEAQLREAQDFHSMMTGSGDLSPAQRNQHADDAILFRKAADTIAALKAQLVEAKEALRPWADIPRNDALEEIVKMLTDYGLQYHSGRDLIAMVRDHMSNPHITCTAAVPYQAP